MREQQINTAATLLSQAEKISDNAWSMIAWLRQYEEQPCEQIEHALRLNGTLYPYFRGLGTLENDVITCSSAYGNKPSTLKAMIGVTPPVARKDGWSLSLRGSYSVPDRPAVIFVRNLTAGRAVWVMVEGQYLIDFMSALGARTIIRSRCASVMVRQLCQVNMILPGIPGLLLNFIAPRHRAIPSA